MFATGPLPGLELETALVEGHAGIGGDDVDAVGPNLHAVLDFMDRHGGGAGEDFAQQAGMFWGEVLDQDEGHACVLGQGLEQMAKGIQASGGGSDSDNRSDNRELAFWDDRGCWGVGGWFSGTRGPLGSHGFLPSDGHRIG
jgi:hypothetical protein